MTNRYQKILQRRSNVNGGKIHEDCFKQSERALNFPQSSHFPKLLSIFTDVKGKFESGTYILKSTEHRKLPAVLKEIQSFFKLSSNDSNFILKNLNGKQIKTTQQLYMDSSTSYMLVAESNQYQKSSIELQPNRAINSYKLPPTEIKIKRSNKQNAVQRSNSHPEWVFGISVYKASEAPVDLTQRPKGRRCTRAEIFGGLSLPNSLIRYSDQKSSPLSHDESTVKETSQLKEGRSHSVSPDRFEFETISDEEDPLHQSMIHKVEMLNLEESKQQVKEKDKMWKTDPEKNVDQLEKVAQAWGEARASSLAENYDENREEELLKRDKTITGGSKNSKVDQQPQKVEESFLDKMGKGIERPKQNPFVLFGADPYRPPTSKPTRKRSAIPGFIIPTERYATIPVDRPKTFSFLDDSTKHNSKKSQTRSRKLPEWK